MANLSTLRRKLHFPPELLLIIKDLLDPSDLRSHVCYYLSSPRVAALYDSADHPDAFWRLACWNCGIGAGLTRGEDGTDDSSSDDSEDLSWKNIALDCIARDGFCSHPQCGEKLLEYNRSCMLDFADELIPFKPYNTSDYEEKITISGHKLFRHIEFKRDRPRFTVTERSPIERDAHLRMPGTHARRINNEDFESQPDDYPGLYLGEHPLAARSFATLAPVSSMLLLYFARTWSSGDGWITLSQPIIIIDVLKHIYKDLDNYLNVMSAYEHISLHEGCIPEKWSHTEAFRVACTMRSMLSVCPIAKLTYEEEDEDGPALALDLL